MKEISRGHRITDIIRNALEDRWILCYMLQDFNILHAHNALHNCQAELIDNAETICAECKLKGETISQDEAYNRALASSVEGWFKAFESHPGWSYAEAEYLLAVVAADQAITYGKASKTEEPL